MSTVRLKECIMLYTVPPFSPQPLFSGDTNVAVFHPNPSCLCGQATSHFGLDRFHFQMVHAQTNGSARVFLYTCTYGCTFDSGLPQPRRGHMQLCQNH